MKRLIATAGALALALAGMPAAAMVGVGGSVSINSTAATDGSTTITAGGTAQNLFSGSTPVNGWTVLNPDPAEDCWASDTTTAAANAVGSIRLAANGGGYETPPHRKPLGPVSVVCATTGHKLTASKW